MRYFSLLFILIYNKRRLPVYQIVACSVLLAATCFCQQVAAQTNSPLRLKIPGNAFILEGNGKNGSVEDIAEGRVFRGKPFATLLLRCALKKHPSKSAEYKMQRIVIHFRTSRNGPSLRTVEFRNGSRPWFNISTHLDGDYTTKEIAQPKDRANVWVWKDPLALGDYSMLRLQVLFPGGIDSVIDPGYFILQSVVVDYPYKPSAPKFGTKTIKFNTQPSKKRP